ncbi:hypothetical protein C2845_PM10G08440 [Panicum miliaceum]|uniref:Peptidase S9 prolyl oligopeptidase catalytic domain-containing protein n=1 Tax=Panicum miliaceum TaxID=4540 RepID=A0A3L6PC80_PANMI|nr:hypothetical protein C2845_PM10G08440 [Panicum miliaceum]
MHPHAAGGAGKAIAPYGSWESPISAAAVSAAGRTAEGLAVAGNGRLVWVETRPEEGGYAQAQPPAPPRAVLVKEPAEPGGKARDVTPQGFAVRSLAQEYGGGAFAVQGDVVVFSNYSDQRLYKQTIGGPSSKICKFIAVLIMCSEDEQSNLVTTLYSLDAEFSKPMWIFGVSSYDFLGKDDSSHKIICCYRFSHFLIVGLYAFQKNQHAFFLSRQNGKSYVGVLDHDSDSFSKIDIPFSSVNNIVSGDGSFYIEGASASLPVSIAKVTLDEKRTIATDFSIVWSSSEDVAKFKSYFSFPESVEFPTVIPGQHAYAYFYAPYNDIFQGSSDEKPPLLVRTHGGPTDEARGVLDLSVQYWTSRGWAFVHVNYGGSSGYGREFRERLLGQWGVVDVNDCCSCAAFLVVSPDQATKIYKAIKDKGLPVALVEYEGEQHGFRKAENIKFTLEQEMAFFARIVGKFKVADDITPIKIENFD